MRKKSGVWVWFIFAGCVVALMYGCSLVDQPLGPIPAIDANGDGIIDAAFVDAVNAGKMTADAVTGGAFSFWLSMASEIILGGLGIYIAGRAGVKKYKSVKAAKAV